MSQNNGRAKRSEKGLLTPDNCAVAFIDHQPQMLFGVSSIDRQSIINNVVALAKGARIFDVPTILSTVETKAFSGLMWPQLKTIFPGREPIERSSMDAWDDRNFVAAVEKTGRKKLVLCGLWTETCIALPTIQAIHDGYEIYVVEDCCGDVNQMVHQIRLALDLHSVGSLPLEEQNVQNSQIEKRRSGFYISCRLDAEDIAELETLIAAVTKGPRIILDLKI